MKGVDLIEVCAENLKIKEGQKKNSNKTIIFENVYLIVFENTHMVISRIEMFENRRKTLIELFLQLQPI